MSLQSIVFAAAHLILGDSSAQELWPPEVRLRCEPQDMVSAEYREGFIGTPGSWRETDTRPAAPFDVAISEGQVNFYNFDGQRIRSPHEVRDSSGWHIEAVEVRDESSHPATTTVFRYTGRVFDPAGAYIRHTLGRALDGSYIFVETGVCERLDDRYAHVRAGGDGE